MANSKPLSWQPTTGPFEVQYRVKGIGAYINYSGNPVASPPIVLTDLQEGTIYEWRVRKDCGGGDFSPWVLGEDIQTGLDCKTPTFLRVLSQESDTNLGNRVTLRWNQILTPTPPPGAENPDIKIFYKKVDSLVWVEWTTTPLPKFYPGTWTSPWTFETGTFEWLVEVQCSNGNRPRRTALDTFTFNAAACPRIPANGITYNATSNRFEWATLPGVEAYQYQIYEREPINNSAYNFLVEKETLVPNTGNWNTDPVNIDQDDFVITNMGYGCVDPNNLNNPPGGNTAMRIEYKPGGVLTFVPKGIILSLLGYASSSPGAPLYKESYQVEAGGGQSTFTFCINWDDRIFVPDFTFKVRVQPAEVGLIPGNSYKLRVRSKCETNFSEWADFEVTIPPKADSLINLHPSIPPQEFSAYKVMQRGTLVIRAYFRIDRPPNPPTNESSWVDVKLGNYPPGSEFIPSVDRLIYPVNGGYVNYKANGDVIATINFVGQGYDSLYYQLTYLP